MGTMEEDHARYMAAKRAADDVRHAIERFLESAEAEFALRALPLLQESARELQAVSDHIVAVWN